MRYPPAMHAVAAQPSPSPFDSFADIARADINLVRVPRALDPFMGARLEAIAQRRTFDHATRLDAADPHVGPLLASIRDEQARAFLSEDIAQLARAFGAALGRRHVHARLQVLRTDGCRKIHVDYVTVRLLCTYAGPGTEWLDNAHLVRANLARRDVDLATANRSLIRDGGALQRCDTGDVLLLKGEKAPGNLGRGAAHRSPPLGDSGISRLIVKLDENPCGC